MLSKFLFQKLGLDNGEGAAQILEAQDEQRFTNDGAQFLYIASVCVLLYQ